MFIDNYQRFNPDWKMNRMKRKLKSILKYELSDNNKKLLDDILRKQQYQQLESDDLKILSIRHKNGGLDSLSVNYKDVPVLVTVQSNMITQMSIDLNELYHAPEYVKLLSYTKPIHYKIDDLEHACDRLINHARTDDFNIELR